MTYITENINVVNRSFKARKLYENSERFKILIRFVGDSENSLSVGSGSYEPIIIGTNAAIDIAPNAEHYLRELGWTGKFVLGTAENMPFKNKEFDTAVCSELIEYLPTMDSVQKTIKEVARVSNRWIFTTPCNPLGPKNTEPTHKRAFTLADLRILFQRYKVNIWKDNLYWYIKYEK